jgi:HD-GYP domain-containing protein (c-di-GMP phosphodiesterase class II)
MISTRAYRNALGRERAIEELTRCRGTQFNEQVVTVFLEILNEETRA